jgi:hypothetical protein
MGPIRRPPHLSAQAIRRYARTLARPRRHPERRLLLAFYEWWCFCVGREIPWKGRENEALDLEWFSPAEHRVVRFSGTAYALLSHLAKLFDSWNMARPPQPASRSEREMRDYVVLLRRRLREAGKLPGARAVEMRDLLRRTGAVERLITKALADRRAGSVGTRSVRV